jgi:MFS family permease
LQGIGGGGLISLVFAIIGDVIPPRQRGRYQGYFGAVFGVSSVVGTCNWYTVSPRPRRACFCCRCSSACW